MAAAACTKTKKTKSKQQAGEQGETSTGQTGSSQDRRWDRGGPGGGAQGYLHNRKKRNAYFGKSLVRLACNQEKNKETNQMKQRDGKRNRTKEKEKQQLQEETSEEPKEPTRQVVVGTVAHVTRSRTKDSVRCARRGVRTRQERTAALARC